MTAPPRPNPAPTAPRGAPSASFKPRPRAPLSKGAGLMGRGLGAAGGRNPAPAIVRLEDDPQCDEIWIYSPIWAKDTLKDAGATWNPDERVWTVNPWDVAYVAAALRTAGFVVHIDDVTAPQEERVAARRRAIIELRRLMKQRALGARR